MPCRTDIFAEFLPRYARFGTRWEEAKVASRYTSMASLLSAGETLLHLPPFFMCDHDMGVVPRVGIADSLLSDCHNMLSSGAIPTNLALLGAFPTNVACSGAFPTNRHCSSERTILSFDADHPLDVQNLSPWHLAVLQKCQIPIDKFTILCSHISAAGSIAQFRKDYMLASLAFSFQRQMLGHLYWNIYSATDAMTTFCTFDDKGILSNEKKRTIISINRLLQPWCAALAQVFRHNQLKKLAQIWQVNGSVPDLDKPGVFVYARINLKTRDMYIGETEHWEDRITCHYRNTLLFGIDRHFARVPKRNSEKFKYWRHRGAHAGSWLTLPIAIVEDKPAARRLERWLILKLQPNINGSLVPLWMSKQEHTYVKCSDPIGRQSSRPLWRARPNTLAPSQSLYANKYYYTTSKKVYLDITPLLTNASNTDTKMIFKVTTGSSDATHWRYIKSLIGRSWCTIDNGPWIFIHKIDFTRLRCTESTFTLTIIPDRSLPPSFTLDRCKDVEHWRKTRLRPASTADLEQIWIQRKELERQFPGYSKAIWEEVQLRYPDVQKEPLTIRLPYHKQLSTNRARAAIKELISTSTNWFPSLISWFVQSMKFVTTTPRSIGDMLNNVNNRWCNHDMPCCCNEIRLRFTQLGYPVECLPCTNGHILFTGREYNGPFADVLHTGSQNIPHHGKYDLKYLWSTIHRQLPHLITSADWNNKFKSCINYGTKIINTNAVPYIREVFQLKKLLNGLVIGPLDKNLGESWACCPHLYTSVVNKIYTNPADYTEIFPWKLSRNAKKKYDKDIINYCAASKQPRDKRSRGTTSDILAAFARVYKQKGWDKYAPFNYKGDFNIPYILFKQKNMIDPVKRAKKFDSARPISPNTSHPMRRLFGMVGKAWSFLTSRIPGDHLVINSSQEVPEFLRHCNLKLAHIGPLDVRTFDIEGCFPSMPKKAISTMAVEITKDFEKMGHTGVYVARKQKAKGAAWSSFRGAVFLPFHILIEVLEFSLHHAYVKLRDGSIRHQRMGIPMGDPLSPGMTIGATAYMERQWLKTISARTRGFFAARRYMDDILLVRAMHSDWDADKLLEEMRSKVYAAPLTLQEGSPDTFLETRFTVVNNQITFYLKNENEGATTKVWRYQHYNSAGRFQTKVSTLLSNLSKVDYYASDSDRLVHSAIAKLREYQRLQYPDGILRHACGRMAFKTGRPVWHMISRYI